MFEFFKRNTQVPQNSGFASFANFLFDFVSDPETLEYFKEKNLYIQTLPIAEQQRSFIRLYLEVENFLLNNDPPKVTERMNKDNLRRLIREKSNFKELDEFFRLFFLDPKEQSIFLFEYCLNRLIQIADKVLEPKDIQPVIDQVCKTFDLKHLHLQEQGLDFTPIHESLFSKTEQDVINIFSTWFKLLLSVAFSKGKEDKIIAQELFDEVERRAGFELASRLASILPPSVVKGDPWRFESRDELLNSVALKTSESDKLRVQLGEKTADENNLKTAMLNLVEDAQTAENEAKKRAEELKTALEQVASFANIADHQRNTYMLLLSSIGEGVLVLDMEQKITITNTAVEGILNTPTADIINTKFEEGIIVLDPDGKTKHLDLLKQVYAEKKIMELNELSISSTKKTGAIPVPVTMVLAPIINKHGEMQGVIITFRDVRQERALEEARISFISIASHQLRTPLTSMRWFAEMLMDGDVGELQEEQKHYIERIYQGTDRMIGLVNLLLQIARVEAGRVKIAPVPSDLKVVTSGVLITLKAILDTKAQKVEIITPEPIPIITMDQDVVWQVIQNLLSNASRYSPQSATITVRIINKGEVLQYSVEDKGIGIPKNARERVFEKFFRAENALKAVPEGSGLGLSLVKLLVEAWGGKIWFESEENKGTTFYFTIPLSGMKEKQGDVGIAV